MVINQIGTVFQMTLFLLKASLRDNDDILGVACCTAKNKTLLCHVANVPDKKANVGAAAPVFVVNTDEPGEGK